MAGSGGRVRICVGFGPTEGKCRNAAGTPWGPHWCPECDERRREHITRRMRELAGRPPVAE